MNSSIDNKKIKVAWFASAFVGRNASGTAQVTRKVLINFIENHSDEIDLFLLAKNQEEIHLIKHDTIFSKQKIILLPSVKGKFLKSSRQFYKFCLTKRSFKFDLVHFSVPRVYPFFWFLPTRKIVCTFHAAGDITAPRDFFVISREIYNLIAKLQWKKFSAIIAVSKFAADEISNSYKIPLKYITTIYPGVDSFWNLRDKAEVQRDRDLVLIVGRWQRYKNIHTVINAFKKYEIPYNKNLKIKVIGKSGSKDNIFILDAIKDFPADQIEFIDYLSEVDLVHEYRRASVVFHPSINEGFGLPAFEAFSEGARLIAHKGTPAEEILHDQPGVIFQNMLSEKQIIESYRAILKQEFGNTEERRVYLESVNATWASSTRRYLEIYKNLLEIK
jgi:glycosyltransferase involved in cell wall biosynthesis